MEYILALSSFLSGVGLTACIAGYFYFKKFIDMLNEVKGSSEVDTYTPELPNTIPGTVQTKVPTDQDVYTPDYTDRSVPLEQFIPNTRQRLKLVVEEDLDQITSNDKD